MTASRCFWRTTNGTREFCRCQSHKQRRQFRTQNGLPACCSVFEEEHKGNCSALSWRVGRTLLDVLPSFVPGRPLSPRRAKIFPERGEPASYCPDDTFYNGLSRFAQVIPVIICVLLVEVNVGATRTFGLPLSRLFYLAVARSRTS